VRLKNRTVSLRWKRFGSIREKSLTKFNASAYGLISRDRSKALITGAINQQRKQER
jgi:hypothetical protein